MTKSVEHVEEAIASLSKDRAELLKLLLEGESRRAQAIKRSSRTNQAGIVRLPASLAQRRMWFLDGVQDGNAGYQVPVALKLSGPLDYELLQRALDLLVQRHEVLRTVFTTTDDGPIQEVALEGGFSLKWIDLREYLEVDRGAQVRFHQSEEVCGKFDLRHGPLIRGRLLQVQADEHVLLLTMHHIVADNWSKGIVVRELVELYRACLDGREGEALDPLPIQYADYAQWHREWMEGGILGEQLQYWRSRLEGLPPQLDLPTDRPRPAVQSYRGGNVGITFDEDLVARLRLFARGHEVTPFMVFCAAWAILLCRLSGQEDLAIGMPIANRQRPELEGLIGLFANTLVLRILVRGDAELRELLHQIKEVTLGAYDHQDAPFERVVEVLQPERSLSRNPLFQVALAFQNTPKADLKLPGMTATRIETVDEPAVFDLLLALEERNDKIVGTLNYAADLFDRATMERWMTCLSAILAGILDGAESRIGDLPLLSEAEEHKIIKQFNRPRTVHLEERSIPELFEQQVERTPQAVAVVYEDECFTYSELNRRSNQLARYLRGKGVGPDTLVAICADRGLEIIVGLLGILKAGAAYVPLDPSYPLDRLTYMLEDATPRALLTQERLRQKFTATITDITALDTDWARIAEGEAGNTDLTAVGLRPENLAYVIYTSGSTGQPKGVMVEHRNVTRLFAATEKWFRFNERDVWTLFHSFAFDFSVWELWGALLHGGRAVVVPHATSRSPLEFYSLLCEQHVTILNQTPSAFLQLIDAQAQTAEKHSLRTIIFGGEALELSTLRPWVRRNGAQNPLLVNMYGITETTVHVTYCPLALEDIDSERASLIGTAISDLQLYLLDSRAHAVPILVPGEAYVGGAGVARGYLNRPQLTAERFLADPFNGHAPTRLYRTGDRARWRPEGTIEYLGRCDDQVKIRGFRIEVGEIEMQLLRHAQVKDAVVVARDRIPGEKCLVAYVTECHRNSLKAEILRTHLQGVLPDYMVPSAFVILEALPLTPNGKLDRRVLPHPQIGAYASQQYEPPQGEVEQVLAQIWQELLHVTHIGRGENFFELGGHSLHGIKLITKIAERLSVRISPVAMFQHPTVELMAKAIGSLRALEAQGNASAQLEFDEEGVI